MGDEKKVCFYQGHITKYNNYLYSLGRENCINCVEDRFNDFCEKRMMVSMHYHDRVMEDNYRIWCWFMQKNTVEEKVLNTILKF